MIKYWLNVEISCSSDNINLPWDLFRFTFRYSKEVEAKFIEFIESVSNRTGYYFNEHYMSELIQIDDIKISINAYSNLVPYIESMELIFIYNDLYFPKYNENCPTLLDKVVVAGAVLNQFQWNPNQIDETPIKSFLNYRRISFLRNEISYFSQIINFLTGNSICIDTLFIEANSQEELNSYTFSEWWKEKICWLSFWLENSIKITENIISYIWKIKPK